MMALLVTLLVYGVGLVAVWRAHHWEEFHHLYLGLPLAAWGVVLGSPWLGWAGALLTADDAFQHVLQVWRPAFRSPLNRLYRRLT